MVNTKLHPSIPPSLKIVNKPTEPLTVGEVHECGAEYGGAEVEAQWTTSNENVVANVGCTILALMGGTSNVTTTANYLGSSDSFTVETVDEKERIRFAEMEKTVQVGTKYVLAFMDTSIVEPNTLDYHISDTSILSIEKSTGTVTAKKIGKALVTVIYKGKKYGHVAEVISKRNFEKMQNEQNSL
jgi:hypothetical protein